MNGELRVVAGAGMDRRGLSGSALASGVLPLAGLTWPKTFSGPHPAFRRLDPLARAVAISAEAAGLGAALDREERTETPLVLASARGCLETDLCFQSGLGPGGRFEPALFPYTLPSSALAETAIRFGLKGPTLSISVEPGEEWKGLEEARQFSDSGVPAVLLFLGDVIQQRAGQALRVAPSVSFVCLLLRASGEPLVSLDFDPGAPAGLLGLLLDRLWERFG